MRTFAGIAAIVLVACGDSTGPDALRLHDGYVIERVEGRVLPAQLTESGPGHALWVLEGGVRCPDPDDGLPDQEVYDLRIEDPLVGGTSRISFAVECAPEPPDRLRYTYPATGETMVGIVWEGAGVEEGRFFQTKRLPSRETFLAEIEAQGWNLEFWAQFIHENPAPEATFRRHP